MSLGSDQDQKRALDSIDPAAIEGFVNAFYTKVQADEVLGPVFARRIVDWEPHLTRMVAFWTAVLHGVPTYTPSPRGAPPALHRAIAELEHGHFERWLTLFQRTLEEELGAHRATLVMGRARRIAGSLSRHLPGPAPDYLGASFRA